MKSQNIHLRNQKWVGRFQLFAKFVIERGNSTSRGDAHSRRLFKDRSRKCSEHWRRPKTKEQVDGESNVRLQKAQNPEARNQTSVEEVRESPQLQQLR